MLENTAGFIGLCYEWLREFDAASTYYARALELDPGNAWALGAQGRVFVHLGRYQDAIVSFDSALKRQETGDAYFNRGVAYQAIGDLTTARASYEKALAIQPGHPEAVVALAQLMASSN